MQHVVHPLTGGLTLRYAAACAGWFAFRMSRSFISARILPMLVSSSSSSSTTTASSSPPTSAAAAATPKKGNKSDNDDDGDDVVSSPPLSESEQQQQQYLQYRMRRAIQKAWQRNIAYLKIWLSSHALDTAVSLLTLPGPWVVARHAPRVMIDAFAPTISDILFKFDRFNHALFLTYANSNLLYSTTAAPAPKAINPYDISSTVAALDHSGVTSTSMTTITADQSAGALNAFLWSVPSTCLSLAKLFYRTRKQGLRKTNFFTCLGVIVVQYAARVPMMSFATMLPMSDSELLFCTLCCIVDKVSEAYLYYHTYPFAD